MKTARFSRIGFFHPRILIGFAPYMSGLILAFAPMSSTVAGGNVAAELGASVPTQGTRGTWTATGDLGTPRWRHTATLLPNDQVLVAGGGNFIDGILVSAELYQSASEALDIQ